MQETKYTLEEMGELQFTLADAALLAGVPLKVFEDDNSNESQEYLKGRLKAQVVTRRQVYEQSQKGKIGALREFNKYSKESEFELENE